MDVLMTIINTELFPTLEEFEDTILFLETSEETPTPLVLENWLCTFGNKGILSKVNGIIFAKPYNEKYFNEYIEVIKKVMKKYQYFLSHRFPYKLFLRRFLKNTFYGKQK